MPRTTSLALVLSTELVFLASTKTGYISLALSRFMWMMILYVIPTSTANAMEIYFNKFLCRWLGVPPQIAWMRWPNVGPARVATLGQRWQSALAQCNVARRGNVGPTVVNQRQPSANQPTINQRWANASMLSGHIAHAWPIKSIILEDHGNHVFF